MEALWLSMKLAASVMAILIVIGMREWRRSLPSAGDTQAGSYAAG